MVNKNKKSKSKFAKNDGTSRTFRLVAAPILQGDGADNQKSYLEPYVPANALKKANVNDQFDSLYTPIKGLEKANVFGTDDRFDEIQETTKSKKNTKTAGKIYGHEYNSEDEEEQYDDDYVDEEEESYFPNDGYDYDTHLRPIGGGTAFIEASGSYNGMDKNATNKGKTGSLNKNVGIGEGSIDSSMKKIASKNAKEEIFLYAGLSVSEQEIQKAYQFKKGTADAEKFDIADVNTNTSANADSNDLLKQDEALNKVRVFKDVFSDDLKGRENLTAEEIEMLDALEAQDCDNSYEDFFGGEDLENVDENENSWDWFTSLAGGAAEKKDMTVWGPNGQDFVEMNKMEARKKDILRCFRKMKEDKEGGDGGENDGNNDGENNDSSKNIDFKSRFAAIAEECEEDYDEQEFFNKCKDESDEDEEEDSDSDLEDLYKEADMALHDNAAAHISAEAQARNLNEFRLHKVLADEYEDEMIGAIEEIVDDEKGVFDGKSKIERITADFRPKRLDEIDDILDDFLEEEDKFKNYHNELEKIDEEDGNDEEKIMGEYEKDSNLHSVDPLTNKILAKVADKTTKIIEKTRQLELECGKDVSMRLLDEMSDVGSDDLGCSDIEYDDKGNMTEASKRMLKERNKRAKLMEVEKLTDEGVLKKFNLPLPKKEAEFDCETVLTTMSNISNHPRKIDVKNTVSSMREKKKEAHLKRMEEQKAAKNNKDKNNLGLVNNVVPSGPGVLTAIVEGDEEEPSTEAEENEDEDEEDEEEDDILDLPDIITVRDKKETKEEKKARKNAVKEYRRLCRANKKENTKKFKLEEKKLKQTGTGDVRQGARVMPM